MKPDVMYISPSFKIWENTDNCNTSLSCQKMKDFYKILNYSRCSVVYMIQDFVGTFEHLLVSRWRSVVLTWADLKVSIITCFLKVTRYNSQNCFVGLANIEIGLTILKLANHYLFLYFFFFFSGILMFISEFFHWHRLLITFGIDYFILNFELYLAWSSWHCYESFSKQVLMKMFLKKYRYYIGIL